MTRTRSSATGSLIGRSRPAQRQSATPLDRVIDSLGLEAATLHVSHQRPEPPEQGLIVDIDGTISDPSHRRHFLEGPSPDWLAFSQQLHLDAPREGAIAQVGRLSSTYMIILCSGRPSYVIGETASWLDRYNVRYDILVLRPPGDRVPGIEHKLRALASMRRHAVKVVAIVDDDDRVRLEFARRNMPSIDLQ